MRAPASEQTTTDDAVRIPIAAGWRFVGLIPAPEQSADFLSFP